MHNRYKLADVESLKGELELLPEIDRESREVSLKDAMKVLVPVLKEMRQRRGYTNEQLLRVLQEKGIHIAESSLKQYLRSSRRGRASVRDASTTEGAELAAGQKNSPSTTAPSQPAAIKEAESLPGSRPVSAPTSTSPTASRVGAPATLPRAAS